MPRLAPRKLVARDNAANAKGQSDAKAHRLVTFARGFGHRTIATALALIDRRFLRFR